MSGKPSGKISLALGGAKKLQKPQPTNSVKRSHATLQDHDEEVTENGRAETVSHFDRSAGGAIDEAAPRRDDAPLVIIPQANRDWRESSKRQRTSKSAKSLANGHGEEHVREELKPTYGLIVKTHSQEGKATTNGHTGLNGTKHGQQTQHEPGEGALFKPKTDDERAIEALLGNGEKSDLVLPAVTEEEAFERDYHQAPDMASLADYERVPVEQFGAALLRGMGWKDGEGIGANRGKKVEKTKLPERRPALLGIGAKEEAAVAQELGTWGKAAKDRKGAAQVYNPVLLRDKKTGEMFTEQELEKKKERDEQAKYEMEFEQEEKRKEKERRRRDRDGSRERDSDWRDKERRRERKGSQERRKNYESDEEYYRRKEKERRRKEQDRGDSDYDRARSKHRDGDRDKRKDRHRDRRR